MDVFVKEPLLDWKQYAAREAKSLSTARHSTWRAAEKLSALSKSPRSRKRRLCAQQTSFCRGRAGRVRGSRTRPAALETSPGAALGFGRESVLVLVPLR